MKNMKIDSYRAGFIVGALGAWGVTTVGEGAEILLNGELVFQWTPTRAWVALICGLIALGLAFYIQSWWTSVQRLGELYGGGNQ